MVRSSFLQSLADGQKDAFLSKFRLYFKYTDLEIGDSFMLRHLQQYSEGIPRELGYLGLVKMECYHKLIEIRESNRLFYESFLSEALFDQKFICLMERINFLFNKCNVKAGRKQFPLTYANFQYAKECRSLGWYQAANVSTILNAENVWEVERTIPQGYRRGKIWGVTRFDNSQHGSLSYDSPRSEEYVGFWGKLIEDNRENPDIYWSHTHALIPHMRLESFYTNNENSDPLFEDFIDSLSFFGIPDWGAFLSIDDIEKIIFTALKEEYLPFLRDTIIKPSIKKIIQRDESSISYPLMSASDLERDYVICIPLFFSDLSDKQIDLLFGEKDTKVGSGIILRHDIYIVTQEVGAKYPWRGINTQDNDGYTLLHVAGAFGRKEVVRKMLKEYCVVFNESRIYNRLAESSAEEDCVKVDCSIYNDEGLTAAGEAYQNGYLDIAKIILGAAGVPWDADHDQLPALLYRRAKDSSRILNQIEERIILTGVQNIDRYIEDNRTLAEKEMLFLKQNIFQIFFSKVGDDLQIRQFIDKFENDFLKSQGNLLTSELIERINKMLNCISFSLIEKERVLFLFQRFVCYYTALKGKSLTEFTLGNILSSSQNITFFKQEIYNSERPLLKRYFQTENHKDYIDAPSSVLFKKTVYYKSDSTEISTIFFEKENIISDETEGTKNQHRGIFINGGSVQTTSKEQTISNLSSMMGF